MSDEYFKNKFRISSNRLKYWDYSCSGLYYITICTYKQECCFSKIKDDQIYLSEVGKIVYEEWLNTPKLRPNVFLDDFIIMPNHFHGIIGIKKEDNDFVRNRRDTARHVSTIREFGYLQPKSLSSIVGAFKSAVTKQCHKNNLKFQWQKNYYEHIIRDEEDYARIKEYIANNPTNWQRIVIIQ
ncbi:transposase [Patescibacteria group bacterium]